jgi:hypothetical protein
VSNNLTNFRIFTEQQVNFGRFWKNCITVNSYNIDDWDLNSINVECLKKATNKARLGFIRRKNESSFFHVYINFLHYIFLTYNFSLMKWRRKRKFRVKISLNLTSANNKFKSNSRTFSCNQCKLFGPKFVPNRPWQFCLHF